MNLPRWVLASAAMFWLLAATVGVSHTASDCAAPQEMIHFKANLPNTVRAIRSGKNLVIVALGSSSTQGVGASDSTHTYPALLAEDLRRRWPQLPITVINKGVGGEMAFQMLARFERDVLPYHPQLVIWQTGSNQVLRSMDIDGYASAVREGISRLKAAQIDVVLMDPQFAPRVIARPMHLLVVDVIDALANEMKVPVFRRFAVMRQWISSGEYKMDDIISSDGLHMNDVSYSCIAHLLAGSLGAAVGPEDPRSAAERACANCEQITERSVLFQDDEAI